MLEAHFGFRRMNVYIDIFVRNRQEQNHYRKSSRGQDIPVCLADRMKNDLVADQPSVDEEEHRIPVVLLNVRPRCKQVNLHAGAAELFLILQQLVEKILAEDLKYTLA